MLGFKQNQDFEFFRGSQPYPRCTDDDGRYSNFCGRCLTLTYRTMLLATTNLKLPLRLYHSRLFGTQRKRLDVSIVGAPNAGKSQLLNAITGSQVAAVSRKRHTTRSQILGVKTVGDTQIVFRDTPGYLVASPNAEKLDSALIQNAVSELDDVDFTLLVVDAAKTITEQDRRSLAQLIRYAMRSAGRIEEDFVEHSKPEPRSSMAEEANERAKVSIVLNKVDLVRPKEKLIDLAMEIGDIADACSIEYTGKLPHFDTLLNLSPVSFYVSALKDIGIDGLVQHLCELATPCRVWVAEEGQSTTMEDIERVKEVIREKIYRQLHQEIPHSISQVNRLFKRIPQGIVIHQDLVVFKKSHQKIVNGQSLQRIEDAATRDLSSIFQCDVVLQLKVKVATK